MLIGGTLACTAAGTRPHFGPQPGAVVDTLSAGPGTVIRTLATQLTAEGLTVRSISAAEGYLETAWFDPVTKRSVGREHGHADRVIRIRAFADSIPPIKTELSLETVFLRTADPSASGREEEILAPPGHPGDSLTLRVLADLRQRLGR